MKSDSTPEPEKKHAEEVDSAGCAPTPGCGRPLMATRDGICLVFGVLIASGGICPDCGYGTRKTSKNWAKCKKCGKRVPRCKMSEVKITNDRHNAKSPANRADEA